MTMLNVFVEADRVRVVMDRAFYGAATPDVLKGLYEFPKGVISDNGLFFIGGRGSTRVGRDIDAVTASATCVDTAILEILDWHAANPDAIPAFSEGEEVVVAGVGLSGAVIAYQWRVAGRGAPAEIQQLTGATLRPAPPEGASLPAEWTDARILAASKWLCTAPQRFRKGGGTLCGGRLDMWTCTAAGVSLRPLGEVDISHLIGVDPAATERNMVGRSA